MTRRLIALLAFLTGLAALGGMASATFAHNTSPCSASVSASEQGAGASEQVQTQVAPDQAAVRDRRNRGAPRSSAPDTLRLPVLMGIERALE